MTIKDRKDALNTDDDAARLIETSLGYRRDVLKLQANRSPEVAERLRKFRRATLSTLQMAVTFLEREERGRR